MANKKQITYDDIKRSEVQIEKTKEGIKLSKVNDSFTAPDFAPVKNKDIIPYGSSEDVNGISAPNGVYPDKLLALYYSSSLHATCIEKKVLHIVGSGLFYDENDALAERTADFIESGFGNEPTGEIASKLMMDYLIFGGMTAFVTFSKDWTRTYTQHLSFEKGRSSVMEKDKDKGVTRVMSWFYSNNWVGTQKPKYRKYELLDFEKVKKYRALYKAADEKSDVAKIAELDALEHTFVYKLTKYTPGREYYPLPDYESSINAIDAAAQVDVSYNAQLKNGFNSDGVLFIPSSGEKELDDREAFRIIQQYTGNLNDGQLMVSFYNNPDNKPEFVSFSPKGKNGRIEQVSADTQEKILGAHGITSPLLLGIKTSGQLGATTELKDANNIFYNTTIKPAQIKLAKYINKIMRYNGLLEVNFKRLDVTVVEDASGADIGEEMPNTAIPQTNQDVENNENN